ncbi:MAG: hypothetical protein WC506_05985 [Candidatus Micrarchaeia archaeon]
MDSVRTIFAGRLWLRAIFLAAIVSLALLSLGCVSGPVNPDKLVEFNITNITRVCSDSNMTPCTVFECKNDSGFLGLSSNLHYGNCSFTRMNYSTFSALNDSSNSDGSFPMLFMIGQGPNATDFARAQTYCNNSLTMPVIWLKGNSTSPPALSSADMAICYLRQNALPVYLYYSAGLNINASASGAIAHELDGEGPVIVSSEVDAGYADRYKVLDQLAAVKANCTKCLTMLAAQRLDLKTINYFLNDSGGSHNSKYVDIVGQGIILNNYSGTCDLEIAIMQNVQFAKYLRQTYGKPILWYYFAASPGKSDDGMCTYTEQDVATAFQRVFELKQILAQSGVIGVAYYGLDSMPRTCTSQACDYGLVSTSGQQIHPEFNGWFGSCQKYMVPKMNVFAGFAANGSADRQCSFLLNLNYLENTVQDTSTPVIPSDHINPVAAAYSCP